MARQMACTECGHVGAPVPMTFGQFVLAVALLLFFVIPGIVYVIYLRHQRTKCARCQNAAMIPVDTPRGREIVKSSQGKGGGFGSREEYRAWKEGHRRGESGGSTVSTLLVLVVLGIATWWILGRRAETTLAHVAAARGQVDSDFLPWADRIMARWKTDSSISDNDPRLNEKVLDLARAEREARARVVTIATRPIVTCLVAGLGDAQTSVVNLRESGSRASFDADMAIVRERMGTCQDLLDRARGK